MTIKNFFLYYYFHITLFYILLFLYIILTSSFIHQQLWMWNIVHYYESNTELQSNQWIIKGLVQQQPLLGIQIQSLINLCVLSQLMYLSLCILSTLNIKFGAFLEKVRGLSHSLVSVIHGKRDFESCLSYWIAEKNNWKSKHNLI